MIKFKVNAENVNIFNKETGKAEYLGKNELGDTNTYDTNTVIALANNGVTTVKEGKTVVVYKPSLQILSGVVEAEGEKISLSGTSKKETKDKTETK